MFKKISRLKKKLVKINKVSRLKKVAEWTQINPLDDSTIQHLTDAMTYNYPVQVNYSGSGWRDVQPYGWNTSKDGNILLMCYKDTGEVRSYRMDKIEDIYIDMDAYGPAMTNNPSMNDDSDLDALVDNLNGQENNYIVDDNYPDDMPMLPEDNMQTTFNNGIYDEELELLENDNFNDIDNSTDFNNIDNEMDNITENVENIDTMDNTIEDNTIEDNTIEDNNMDN